MTTESAGHDTKANVLVVDDDEGICAMIRRVLDESNYKVTTATSAHDALQILNAQHFDTLIVDIMMPTMSGLELLRQVRQRDRELPVIILTGYPTLESAILAVQESSFRYLTKPCAATELRKVVREATAMYRLSILKRRAQDSHSSSHWKTESFLQSSTQFDAALQGLWMAFQPIVNWSTRTLVGYEALVRSSSPTLGNPGLLFDTAERLGRVGELGRRIRTLVAQAIGSTPPHQVLFVNLHAADLNDEELQSPDAPLSKYAGRVVLEITERASLERVRDVQGVLANLRTLGFKIAVDDLGAGYAGLSSFSQLEPDVVKLDMSLIRGIDASKRKTSIVSSMIAVCTRDLGTKVVCEGVETRAELETLDGIGATLLQGYLFGKPDRRFIEPDWTQPSFATTASSAQ